MRKLFENAASFYQWDLIENHEFYGVKAFKSLDFRTYDLINVVFDRMTLARVLI